MNSKINFPISIYNIKGGVGKSTIAVQLSKILNYGYISNDAFAGATDFLDEEKGCLIPEDCLEIPVVDKMVYDFGGFKDSRIIEVLKETVVIVPTLISPVDLKSTISILKELSEIKEKVIVVINRVSKEQEYADFVKYIEDENINMFIEFCSLRESNFLKKSIIEEVSIFETAELNKFNKFVYRNLVLDFENLLEKIITQGE